MYSPIAVRFVARGLLAAFVGCVASSAQAQDQVVSGNLSVTGDADIGGDTLSFGTRGDSATAPGLNLFYSDGTAASVYFNATRPTASWFWQNDTGVPQLQLSTANQLLIYDRAATPTPKITLNPVGVSTISNSVTINGTNNLMPNQTLTGPGSVLTQATGLTRAAADGMYLRQDSAILDVNADVRIGAPFNPSAKLEVAGDVKISGNLSVESSAGSISLGQASAIGAWSAAINATAEGDNSTAIGEWAYAIGGGSLAMNGGIANADFSIAIGFGTTTYAPGQVVVGYNNINSGNLDDLFVIGNGDWEYYLSSSGYAATPGASPSTAFVIKKNGDMWVQGDSTLNGNVGIGTSTPAAKLDVVGDAKVSGTLSSAAVTTSTLTADTITVKIVLRVPPAGDLSMGTFTAGTNPAD